MKRWSLVLTFVLLVVIPCLSQESDTRTVSGYVTRVATPSEFDVNGIHVLVNDKTRVSETAAKGMRPYVGQPVQVHGKFHHATYTMDAAKLVWPPPSPRVVAASGIVDAILPLVPGASSANDHLLRADGYPVLVSAKTATTFSPPLAAASAFRANIWITFHGRQRPDGVVVADTAILSQNTIGPGEDKLRSKREYDPSAVDPGAKQSGLSKAFRGIDVKRIPPYKDDAMQTRVSAIGAKLVPQYQRDLPATDATKINFRFQVVDQKKWRDALILPNGIMLVPHQVVERMRNDSQLAAVLADNIALALEKQSLRVQPAAREMTAAQLAGDVGGVFVPGLGLATLAVNTGASVKILRRLQDQGGRVSLALLHDAGYDINEAPVAWWLLAPEEPTDIHDVPMPRRVAYLYKTLGETWHVD
jgi:hypothetical protein